MNQYTLDTDTIRAQYKKSQLFIALLVLLINGIAVAYFFATGQQGILLIKLIPVLMPTLIIGGVISSTIARNYKTMNSYALTIEGNHIRRIVGKFPPVELSFDEITEIHKNSNGTLTIKGNDSRLFIHVPATIKNKSALEQELSRIQPLTEITTNSNKKYLTLLMMVTSIVLMIVFYNSKNKWVFVPIGSILIGLMLVTTIITLRNPVVNKSRVILYLIVGAMMAFTLYTKLKLFS